MLGVVLLSSKLILRCLMLPEPTVCSVVVDDVGDSVGVAAEENSRDKTIKSVGSVLVELLVVVLGIGDGLGSVLGLEWGRSSC